MTGVRLDAAEAQALIEGVFRAAGVAAPAARATAAALVSAEIDGQPGHGFSRVEAYAAQARSGKVDGAATPVVTRAAPAFLRIDAADGFAFPALDAAIAPLAALAHEMGVAAAAVTRSHHCGQLGRHVERLAEAGCAALMLANTPKAMAPWGGTAAFFGTNPIAFAAPRDGHAPLVIDLSLSAVARGKVMAAAQKGQPIPEGWAFDAEGRPTTDPQAALKGAMAPMGGAKGAALALMVETLAAGLTGAAFSHEAASFFDAEGAPPRVGQLLIAFGGPGLAQGFAARLEVMLAAMLAQEGARLPGDRRLAARARAADQGLAMPAALHARLTAALGGAR